MVWYEKLLLAVVVVLTAAAFVDLFRPVGPDLPYGALGGALGILGTVLILQRRKRAGHAPDGNRPEP
jgi:membrane associated rhomboid family serine protease